MSTPLGQTSGGIPTQSTPNRVSQATTSNPHQGGDQGAQAIEKDSSSAVDMSVMSPDPAPEGLLPAFLTRGYSHLPTPQSPKNLGQYVAGVPYTPESPVPHAPYPYPALAPVAVNQRLGAQRSLEEHSIRSPSRAQQVMTPESSPLVLRATPSRHTNTSTPRFNPPLPSAESTTPKLSSIIKLESPLSDVGLAPAHRISSPLSAVTTSSSDPQVRSSLSSPFMAKMSIADHRSSKSKTPLRSRPASSASSPSLRPMQIDDVFSSTSNINSAAIPMSTPPSSPPPGTAPAAGGEMERIRQAIMQDKMAQFREAESRRPEYLKRAKRTLADADPSVVNDEERLGTGVGVAIMESPHKGRRLTLFQETSEESFEESLMAGGYGRYRTADWVRQPQPLSTPGPAGPSNIISLLEAEATPTERELKKRKRLAAFRGNSTATSGLTTKLFPVELEGKGRVLLDVPSEEQTLIAAIPEPTPTKRRGGNRRKKKGGASEREPSAKEKKALALAAAAQHEAELDHPNWPDAEFPWRLRMEERAEIKKAEEEERLQWIEKFLDRDTDDEDDEDDEGRSRGEDEELPLTKWGLDQTGNIRVATERGRGKMVPLPANPHVGGSGMGDSARLGGRSKSTFFPSDPADARAALLSKKSVRALSYRHQRRRREAEDDSEEEVVCLCSGRDDGRELVQCDGCQMWYHLQCIGIKNIAELGKEEDPWFCDGCVAQTRRPSSSPEPDIMEILSSEPTFVPTEEEPRVNRSFDAPFFQAPGFQDSPMTAWSSSRMPKTPTRGGEGNSNGDLGSGFSSTSTSSWVNSSRPGPTTPQHPTQGVRVYTNTTPGPFDLAYNYEESPFDPTSTPSRGIKFGAPFATPKNNLWSTRANGLFQTPSKPGGRGSTSSSRTLGATGSLDESSGSSGGLSFSPYRGLSSYDDSPIRRSKSGDWPKGFGSRRLLESPPAGKPLSHYHSLEDSPVMRSKGKERLADQIATRSNIAAPVDRAP